jgi:hypothetical protein
MTRDLIYGIAAAIQGSRERFRELAEYLESMFGFGPYEAEVAAELWQTSAGTESSLADGARERGLLLLPDVTDVLSTMDVIIAEEGGLGFAGARDGDRFLDATRLRAVREQIARALFQSFHFVESRLGQRPAVIGEFVRRLRPSDVVITSNWDILVDQARDDHFGTAAEDYGTPVSLVAPGTLRSHGGRPGTLLKLHGSMNWAYCRRCHVLWVNPQLNLGRFLADLGPLRDQGAPNRRSDGGDCDCYFPLSPLLVTPTYLKEYRNHHLANVWAEALASLAGASEWISVGYSLPSDDVHIKTLLLKARRMRDEANSPTTVSVVTDGRDEALGVRYGRLFRNATIFENGFKAYLQVDRTT